MRTSSRVALIGVGGIGSYHLSAIQDLEREGLVRLVAVADPGSGRFPELKNELHARGVRWHADYHEMLRKEAGLDAVVIATPIPLHYEMALACIDYGAFVLLEKPPVPLIQQLDDLIAADIDNRVCVGFQMIGSRFIQQLKSAIVSGQIGDLTDLRACGCWPRSSLYYNRASWAGKMMLDGKPVFDGPATNALAHLIHNIMFLAAPGQGEFDVPAEVRGELYRARRIESYNVACLRGRFGSGVRFAAAFTHATSEALPFQLEARGTKGWIRISEDGARIEGSAMEKAEGAQSTQELLLHSHREFVGFIKGERASISTQLRDTRGYVLATNGMLASAGQIHDIGEVWIRGYHREDDYGVNVLGLRANVEETFQTGRLFSEQGVQWAKPSPDISLENFSSMAFPDYTAATPQELTERVPVGVKG